MPDVKYVFRAEDRTEGTLNRIRRRIDGLAARPKQVNVSVRASGLDRVRNELQGLRGEARVEVKLDDANLEFRPQEVRVTPIIDESRLSLTSLEVNVTPKFDASGLSVPTLTAQIDPKFDTSSLSVPTMTAKIEPLFDTSGLSVPTLTARIDPILDTSALSIPPIEVDVIPRVDTAGIDVPAQEVNVTPKVDESKLAMPPQEVDVTPIVDTSSLASSLATAITQAVQAGMRGVSAVGGNLLGGAGNLATGGVGRTLVATGAAAGMYATYQAMNLDQVTDSVAGVMRIHEDTPERQRLENLLGQLGRGESQFNVFDFGFMAEVLAKNAVPLSQMEEGALEAASRIAEALVEGGGDPAEIAPLAADIVTNAMVQFGISGPEGFRQIGDLATSFVLGSPGGIMDLHGMIAQGGSTVGPMGMSFEDFMGLATAVMPFAASGGEGGGAIKSMFLTLGSPTGPALKALDEAGLLHSQVYEDVYKTVKDEATGEEVQQLVDRKLQGGTSFIYDEETGELRGMTDILTDLLAVTNEMTTAQRTTFLEQATGRYGIKAVNALQVMGVEGFMELLAFAQNVDASEIAGIKRGNVAAEWNMLSGKIQTVAAEGAAPAQDFLQWYLQTANRVVDSWLAEDVIPPDSAAAEAWQPGGAPSFILPGTGPVTVPIERGPIGMPTSAQTIDDITEGVPLLPQDFAIGRAPAAFTTEAMYERLGVSQAATAEIERRRGGVAPFARETQHITELATEAQAAAEALAQLREQAQLYPSDVLHVPRNVGFAPAIADSEGGFYSAGGLQMPSRQMGMPGAYWPGPGLMPLPGGRGLPVSAAAGWNEPFFHQGVPAWWAPSISGAESGFYSTAGMSLPQTPVGFAPSMAGAEAGFYGMGGMQMPTTGNYTYETQRMLMNIGAWQRLQARMPGGGQTIGFSPSMSGAESGFYGMGGMQMPIGTNFAYGETQGIYQNLAAAQEFQRRSQAAAMYPGSTLDTSAHLGPLGSPEVAMGLANFVTGFLGPLTGGGLPLDGEGLALDNVKAKVTELDTSEVEGAVINVRGSVQMDPGISAGGRVREDDSTGRSTGVSRATYDAGRQRRGGGTTFGGGGGGAQEGADRFFR